MHELTVLLCMANSLKVCKDALVLN